MKENEKEKMSVIHSISAAGRQYEVARLLAAEPLTQKEICKKTGMSQSQCSQLIQKLRGIGIVEQRNGRAWELNKSNRKLIVDTLRSIAFLE